MDGLREDIDFLANDHVKKALGIVDVFGGIQAVGGDLDHDFSGWHGDNDDEKLLASTDWNEW